MHASMRTICDNTASRASSRPVRERVCPFPSSLAHGCPFHQVITLIPTPTNRNKRRNERGIGSLLLPIGREGPGLKSFILLFTIVTLRLSFLELKVLHSRPHRFDTSLLASRRATRRNLASVAKKFSSANFPRVPPLLLPCSHGSQLQLISVLFIRTASSSACLFSYCIYTARKLFFIKSAGLLAQW